jgi:hypothetical protein
MLRCLGFDKREELQTTEILQRVHNHNPNGSCDSHLSGTLKSFDFIYTTKCLLLYVFRLRDLRQLCFENINFKGASIEIRRHCILINLIHIRAIILNAKVMVSIHLNM